MRDVFKDLPRSLTMIVWRRLRNSHFMRSVAVLGAGTLLAQIIMIAASPILTRLYQPSDFGVAALFAAIISSFAPAICGKYDVAIVVARSIPQSKQLLGISFYTALALSSSAMVFFVLFRDPLIDLLNAERLGNWILLAPPTLFFTGILTSLNYYSNRTQEYHLISRTKIQVSIIGVTSSILFGVFQLGYGLLLSNVIATIFVSIWLVYRYRSTLDRTLISWTPRKKAVLGDYRDFPLYDASMSLLDGLMLSLPVFFLSRYFPDAIVGYYALMTRVATAPLGFISSSVSQVNLKKTADLLNNGQSAAIHLAKTTLMLTALVLPVAAIVISYAPILFAYVFGAEWEIAGDYLRILMPALALRFVVSTISSVFSGARRNDLVALWKSTSFAVSVAVLSLVSQKGDAHLFFVTIMITDLFLYSFYYLLAWVAITHPRARSVQHITQE